MSKTFTSRPALSQRGRGRGRGTTNNVEATVTGEGVRPSRAPSTRGTAGSRGVVGTRTMGASRGGAGVGRGRSPDRGLRGKDSTPKKHTLEERAMYAGGFTVIRPDEKRRREVAEQAEKEARQYEQYKKQNKPTSFSYVGTAGGGESVSMAEARQQQIQNQIQHNKTNRLLREQDRRDRQREEKNRALEGKKVTARRQSNTSLQKQTEKKENWKSEMNRVNQAFLDRLEAQSKTTGASSQSAGQT